MQGALLAGLTAGIALAGRHRVRLLRPAARPRRCTARASSSAALVGTLGARGRCRRSWFLLIALVFGARYPGGVAGRARRAIVLARADRGGHRRPRVRRSRCAPARCRCCRASSRSSFVLLFTAPAFFPRELLTPALQDDRAPTTRSPTWSRACARCSQDDRALGDPLARARARPCGAGRGDDRARDARAARAAAHAHERASPTRCASRRALARSLNEVLRVRGALLPATIAPVIFLLGIDRPVRPPDRPRRLPDRLLPVVDRAAVVPAGRGLRRRRRRLEPRARHRAGLVRPAARRARARGRCWCVGPDPRRDHARDGARRPSCCSSAWRSAPTSPAASPGCSRSTWPRPASARSRAVGRVHGACAFRTQQAGPLMQQGVFLAVFLSTAYTPQVAAARLARRGRRT